MNTPQENNEARASRYHHGDLRNSLIIAAAELIEENGSLDFAMIDAARRAGVSSAAPYRHFKDKDALLFSVCQLALLALASSVEETAERYPAGTAERVVALGKTYVRFVMEHRKFFDLLWGDPGLRAMSDASDPSSGAGFYVLVENVQLWMDREGICATDPLDVATKLWAIAHGLSALVLSEHIDRFLPGADVYDLLETTTNTFLAGLPRSR